LFGQKKLKKDQTKKQTDGKSEMRVRKNDKKGRGVTGKKVEKEGGGEKKKTLKVKRGPQEGGETISNAKT